MGLACDHEHAEHHLGTAEVDRALAAVEARCAADGERMTAPRRRVLEHRIASISAYVACTADALGEDKGHAAAFLICDCCGAAEEVAVQGGDAFARAAAGAGYAIERTTIEGHGRCPACRVAA